MAGEERMVRAVRLTVDERDALRSEKEVRDHLGRPRAELELKTGAVSELRAVFGSGAAHSLASRAPTTVTG